MKRTLLMLSAAATALLAVPGQSAAEECQEIGTIVAVTANQDTTSTPHEIAYKTGALDDAVFTITTDSDSMAILAATLLTSQAQVTVTSNAAIACPTDVGGDAGMLDTLMPE